MEGQSAKRNQKGGQEQPKIQHLREALQYFKSVESKVPLKGNSTLLQHSSAVESFGLQHGIPADGIEILLNVALSGNLADAVSTRLLKCIVPASEVPQHSIINAVSLFCVGKCSSNTQILFLRWLITVFDFIPHKDFMSSLYNFFFCFLQDDKLCPYLCHLLYLLTKKEHVRPFRVRKLLELQSKKGLQPYLLGLLSIYKIFCPELVSLSLPRRHKTYFKESHVLWRSELRAISKRNAGDPMGDHMLILGNNGYSQNPSRKRKWNSNLSLAVCSHVGDHSGGKGPVTIEYLMSENETFPVEKLQTFSQLLENIHRIELPAQMGCVLKSPLLLHYINCIKDDTPFVRLNYWLASTLHEECAWYTGNKRNKEEVENFLETVVNTQQFLQEGLSSCEEFLYRCLPHWNGCHRSQILQLISWIPLSSSSELDSLLYEPLAQLFVSTSVYFKCSVIESLKELLKNWLIWHSVCAEQINTQGMDMNDTMSGLLTSVDNLVQFTGRLSTLGLQIHNSSLLLHFILDFYETVCDMYVHFSLPLIILPPPGVFYPALLSMDCVNLNQLCYIMYRYRTNLVTAKSNERQKKGGMNLNINSQTFQEYNQYLTSMVGCLWTSQAFHQDSHPQGIQLEEHILESSGVPLYKKSFNIVFHPALMSYAALFLRQRFPEDKMFQLTLIKGRHWNTYLEFLYSQGLDGLKLFIESSVNRLSTNSQQVPHDLIPSQR
ncbi:centromere protein I [Bombina bombina]|uniref:centromere protein I n=1 Tax=Bombina bombina TaxID=8345 RepID=UPI00235A6F3D|nr:centromere protein I [Bombina bombina]